MMLPDVFPSYELGVCYPFASVAYLRISSMITMATSN